MGARQELLPVPAKPDHHDPRTYHRTVVARRRVARAEKARLFDTLREDGRSYDGVEAGKEGHERRETGKKGDGAREAGKSGKGGKKERRQNKKVAVGESEEKREGRTKKAVKKERTMETHQGQR